MHDRFNKLRNKREMVSNFEETFEQTSMSPEIVFKVGSYENVINYLID